MILWRISSARLTLNPLHPKLSIPVKRKDTFMFKKILEKLTERPKILLPFIIAIGYNISPLYTYDDMSILGYLCFLICLTFSVITIAIWLKDYPWIYYPYVFLAYIDRWHIQIIALLMFPIINGIACLKNTTLTCLFKTALNHQPTSADKYKRFHSLVVYYTTLVLISIPITPLSLSHFFEILPVGSRTIHPLYTFLISYWPIYLIFCIITLCAHIALFRIKKINKQMQPEETSAPTPEDTNTPRNSLTWFWIIVYILITFMLLPTNFMILSDFYHTVDGLM